MDGEMFHALDEIGAQLRADVSNRAIVISGDGSAFCSGLDVEAFSLMAKGTTPVDLAARTRGICNLAQHICLQWRQMPVPVIAAVQGAAFGAGFQLALGADMRFVHPDAMLSIMEITWGLIPDMAGMLLMRDLARPDVIAELAFTGRVFSGREADRHGFVTRLCDEPIASALACAEEIAARNPDAVRAMKRVLSIQDQALATEILLAEASEQAALIGSRNQLEAVVAKLDNRAPLFETGP